MGKHKTKKRTTHEIGRWSSQPVEAEEALKVALDHYEELLQREAIGYRFYPPALYQTYQRVVEGAGEDLPPA